MQGLRVYRLRHCERSEAIQSRMRRLDCFAALAMTWSVHVFTFSRRHSRPSFASFFTLQIAEGAGKTG